MTRSTDPRSAAGDLPSFLGETRGADAAPERADAAGYDDQLHAVDDGGAYDDPDLEAYDDGAGEAEGYEEEAYEDDVHEPEDYGARAARPARPTSANRRRTSVATTPAGGNGATAAGAALALLGFAQLFVPAVAEFAPAGWTAQLTLTIGAVLVALGVGQRRVGAMQQQLEEHEQERAARDAMVTESLEQLLARSADRDPEADRSEQALLALQRQDQKINNLTKATKMYGKPLMEIAAQGAEVSGKVSQLQAALKAIASERDPARGELDLGPVADRIDAVTRALAELHQQTRADSRACRDALEQLHSQPTGAQSDEQLQVRLAEATTRISADIDRLRDQNFASIEASVSDIRREVTALAGAVGELQTAPAAGKQPSPPAEASSQATEAGAPSDAPAQAAGAERSPLSDEGSGYATGARKSRGANVLGAIAKLKQMKG